MSAFLIPSFYSSIKEISRTRKNSEEEEDDTILVEEVSSQMPKTVIREFSSSFTKKIKSGLASDRDHKRNVLDEKEELEYCLESEMKAG